MFEGLEKKGRMKAAIMAERAGILSKFGLDVKEGVPKHVYDLFKTFEFGACPRPQYAKY